MSNKRKENPLNKQEDMFRPESTSRKRALELLEKCKEIERLKNLKQKKDDNTRPFSEL